SGDQTGPLGDGCVIAVNCACPVPSAFIVQICGVPPVPGSRSYAIFPVTDHDGLRSVKAVPVLVRLTCPVPVASATQISSVGKETAYAILVPSGDHAGSV